MEECAGAVPGLPLRDSQGPSSKAHARIEASSLPLLVAARQMLAEGRWSAFALLPQHPPTVGEPSQQSPTPFCRTA